MRCFIITNFKKPWEKDQELEDFVQILAENLRRPMAKHLEDFLDLSSGELKFYLQQRALPSSGTHLDLAARALVAFEQQTPVKQSAEDLSKSLKDQYGELLKQYNLLKDPLDINDWEEEVTKWPKTHIGHVFSYILEMKAFSTEYVGQYKVRKAYSYFTSGFVKYSQSLSEKGTFSSLLK